MFQGKLWNLRNTMRSSVPTKRISRIFDIGDLRSGHFCDLPIISQWAKNKLRYIYFGASIFRRTVVDNSGKNLHCLPLERSLEVTRGHQPSFANNFWSKRDRDVGLVSVRSSRLGKSTDRYAIWPISVITWPWPDLTWCQTLTLTF